MNINTAGTYTLRYTAEDSCGNESVVNRQLEVSGGGITYYNSMTANSSGDGHIPCNIGNITITALEPQQFAGDTILNESDVSVSDDGGYGWCTNKDYSNVTKVHVTASDIEIYGRTINVDEDINITTVEFFIVNFEAAYSNTITLQSNFYNDECF